MGILHRLTDRTPAVTNLALGLVLAVLLTAESAWLVARGEDWLPGAVLAVLLGALVLLRRGREPRAAMAGLALGAVAAAGFGAAALPAQPGVSATASLLVLGTACARRADPRGGAVVAAAGVAVLVLSRLGLRPSLVVPVALLGLLLWTCALGAGLWLRSLDTHRLGALAAARRDERLELARELHDLAAHHLTGIVVQAQGARLASARHPDVDQHVAQDVAPQVALDVASQALDDIGAAASEALEAMRAVVGLLRDDSDSAGTRPGAEPLDELLDRFARRLPDVELDARAEIVDGLPVEVRATVHRIVQEALSNVVLHASSARRVQVIVERGATGVTVEVTDDAPTGTGPRPAGGAGGHGLLGMEERARALGGTFSAGPRPAGGWSVRAALPTRDGEHR